MNGDVAASGKSVRLACALGDSKGPHGKSLIVLPTFNMICPWRGTRCPLSFAAYTDWMRPRVSESVMILFLDSLWSEAGPSAARTKDSGQDKPEITHDTLLFDLWLPLHRLKESSSVGSMDMGQKCRG